MNKEIAWLGLKSYLLNYADNESILGRQYYISDNADIDNVVVFAELIVRECVEIANSGIDPTESHLIGDDILKHFGIEEYFNRVLQKQVETTGIDYYCGCCGKPHYVGKDFEHNKECIWYEGE